jgi:hypothetical protein
MVKKLLSPNPVKNLWDIELGLIRGFPKFWKKLTGNVLFGCSRAKFVVFGCFLPVLAHLLDYQHIPNT